MITEFSPVFVRMFSCELHTIRGRPLSKRGSSAGQWIVDPFWDLSDRKGLVFDIRAHINQWLRHVCVPTRKHAGFTQTNRAGSAERKSFRKTFFNKISPFFSCPTARLLPGCLADPLFFSTRLRFSCDYYSLGTNDHFFEF